MRLALIADAYPPLRTSCAVQMRDLAHAMADEGHQVSVLVPAGDQVETWRIYADGPVEIVRLKAPITKDVGYVRRTLAELAMPHAMLRNLRRSPAADRRFDGVVWYSPSIFFAPLVRALKRRDGCPAYLILRDIFPQWAADMGLMGRGLPFRVFDTIAERQYDAADTIGVQTPGNLPFFAERAARGQRVEVLANWLGERPVRPCSIDLSTGPIGGRMIAVYAGNMGVAQGMDALLDCAAALKDDNRFGFAFVGRGSDAQRLRDEAAGRGLTNIVFHDEIDPDEIPGLYAQAALGLVALDPRHRTHNIPGKFISYMHAGLPVVARVNPGNDLEQLVREEGVGRVSTDPAGADLPALIRELSAETADPMLAARCRTLAARMFSSTAAARQVVSALSRG